VDGGAGADGHHRRSNNIVHRRSPSSQITVAPALASASGVTSDLETTTSSSSVPFSDSTTHVPFSEGEIPTLGHQPISGLSVKPSRTTDGSTVYVTPLSGDISSPTPPSLTSHSNSILISPQLTVASGESEALVSRGSENPSSARAIDNNPKGNPTSST
jgi:hypothetical protein